MWTSSTIPDISLFIYFFLLGFSFTDTDDSRDSRGREGTIFFSTLPVPPAHKHWDIYLPIGMWDDYHVFLIARLVFTRLLLDEIYHLIELPFDWLIDDATDDQFILSSVNSYCYFPVLFMFHDYTFQRSFLHRKFHVSLSS